MVSLAHVSLQTNDWLLGLRQPCPHNCQCPAPQVSRAGLRALRAAQLTGAHRREGGRGLRPPQSSLHRSPGAARQGDQDPFCTGSPRRSLKGKTKDKAGKK